jgi:hypothetical protein
MLNLAVRRESARLYKDKERFYITTSRTVLSMPKRCEYFTYFFVRSLLQKVKLPRNRLESPEVGRGMAQHSLYLARFTR